MSLETGLIILVVMAAVLALLCTPLLIKLWRAVHDLTLTLEIFNQRLPDILQNLDEISANVNRATTAVNDEVQKYAATANRLHYVVDHVVTGIEWVSPLVAKPAGLKKMTELIALGKGLRAFARAWTGGKKI